MSKLLNFFEYVMTFFIGNLLFAICNLPIILFLFLFDIKDINSYTPLFLLCLLPIAPALTALLYTMNRFNKLKSVSIFKDYFRSYKQNFIMALKAGGIQIILMLSILTNLNRLHKLSWGYMITPFMYIMLFLITMMSLYLYSLIAKFHINLLEAYKASLILTITKPLHTFTNILIFIFALVLFQIKASYMTLFAASLICYLLMFNQRKILEDIEQRSIISSSIVNKQKSN